MPRVSAAHTSARRQQILDAARVCFLREGFHQTSMLDLQREANLSAGAVYSYFKSKKDIILGIATENIATMGSIIPDQPIVDGEMLSLPDLINVFLARSEALHQAGSVFPMAVQVWAEAIRDPELLKSLQANMDGIKERLLRFVGICQERALVHPDIDPVALTMAIIGLGQGYMVQRVLFTETDPRQFADGVAALLLNARKLDVSRLGLVTEGLNQADV